MNILTTNNFCNNNCIYCNKLKFKDHIYPSIDKIIYKLYKLKNKGIKKITFPCNTELRTDFNNLLQETKKLNYKITLLTNGRFFYYLNNCLNVHKYIDYFEFFINENTELNNNITRSKSFLESIQGIKNLLKLNANIKTIIIINDNNYNKIENYIKINKDIGIKEINIIYDIPKDKKHLLNFIKNIVKKYHNKTIKILKSKINNYTIKNHTILKKNKYSITIISYLTCITGAALYTVNMAKYLSDFFNIFIILMDDKINNLYNNKLQDNRIELISLSDIDYCIKVIKKSNLLFIAGAGTLAKQINNFPKLIIESIKLKKRNRILMINHPDSVKIFEILDDTLEEYFDILCYPSEHFLKKDHSIFNNGSKLKEIVLYHPVFENYPKQKLFSKNNIITIGRMSRDHIDKFSEDTKNFYKFLEKYDFNFIFLGGKLSLRNIFPSETLKNNWKIYEEGKLSKENFFNKIDIFLYKTSKKYKEYFGNVIIEAMYHGIPVVTENRDSYKEQIIDKKTGFLCNNNDEFYKRVIELKNNIQLRKKISKNAQNYVMEKFNLEEFKFNHIINFLDIIDNINSKTLKKVPNSLKLLNIKNKKIINKFTNQNTILFLYNTFIPKSETDIFNFILNLKSYNKIVLCNQIRNIDKIFNNNIPTFILDKKTFNKSKTYNIISKLNIKIIHCLSKSLIKQSINLSKINSSILITSNDISKKIFTNYQIINYDNSNINLKKIENLYYNIINNKS